MAAVCVSEGDDHVYNPELCMDGTDIANSMNFSHGILKPSKQQLLFSWQVALSPAIREYVSPPFLLPLCHMEPGSRSHQKDCMLPDQPLGRGTFSIE